MECVGSHSMHVGGRPNSFGGLQQNKHFLMYLRGSALYVTIEEEKGELGTHSEMQVIQGGASDMLVVPCFQPPMIRVSTDNGMPGWEVVSKDAAMSASEDTMGDNTAKVEARISQACYGFKCYYPWVDGSYDKRDKSWPDVRARYLATNQFEWFLKKVCAISNN